MTGTRAVLSQPPPCCQSTMTASEAAATASAQPLKVSRCVHSVLTMPKKSPGILAMRRPRKSLICDSATSTAMPLVKPMMTATGMKRTSVPSRSSPIRNKKTPDMAVAMMRLPTP